MLSLKVPGVTSGSLEQELEQLFRENYQMLYRTAYSLSQNQADAEDVPQSLFLRLLRSGMTPDVRRNATGYLYRAAVNLSLNMIRERKRQAVTEEFGRFEVPVARAESEAAEEADRHLAEAIADQMSQ